MLKIKVYGNPSCPDCKKLQASIMANDNNIQVEGYDISNPKNLKEFLILRDTRIEFADIKLKNQIGIPCIILDDGSITFDWESIFIKKGLSVVNDNEDNQKCSIDGKNC
ncbi:MAG: hypothetical protein ACI4V7_01040 [Succinivibrionaceae bacterium]